MSSLLGTSLVQPVNWQDPVNRGLQAWFLVMPGNDGGSIWRDITKRGHYGLMIGFDTTVDWRSAHRPGGYGALYFNQTSNRINVISADGTVSEFKPNIGGTSTSPLAVSVWAYITRAPDANYRGIASSDFSFNPAFLFNMPSNNWGMYWNGNVDSGEQLPRGSWQHLVWTRDTSSDIHLYRNGELVNVVNNTSTWPTNPNNKIFRIGGKATTGPFEVKGFLDDFRVWNRYLTPKEVKHIYLDSLGA